MKKIKIVKDLKVGTFWIRSGEIFNARLLVTMPVQFNPPYQIIEGRCSGITVPREHCMELPQENTYTEKQWNDMKNHYQTQLENERNSKIVEVPQEVFEAFERVKANWGKFLDKNDLCGLLLNIHVTGTSGDSLILKEFASSNPYEYVKALANGCKPTKTSVTDEVYDILQSWLSTEYVEDEATDIRNFAEKLTNFYSQKLTKTS